MTSWLCIAPRQRHHLYLGGLPVESQPGVEDEGRYGAQVNWPVGLGGKGNEGVAGQVKQTPNSHRICRADLCRAEQDVLRQGEERRRRLRQGDLASVTAAAAGAAKKCRTISASPSPMLPVKTPIRSPVSPGC